MKTTLRLIPAVALLADLAGCGNKGALVHPPKPTDELPVPAAPVDALPAPATMPVPASTSPAAPAETTPPPSSGGG